MPVAHAGTASSLPRATRAARRPSATAVSVMLVIVPTVANARCGTHESGRAGLRRMNDRSVPRVGERAAWKSRK